MTTRTDLLRPDAVILATGGGRGITAQCVTRLAEVSPCKFVLLGRSDLEAATLDIPAEIHTPAEMKKEIFKRYSLLGKTMTPAAVEKEYQRIAARREIQATMDAIRRAGGEALYLRADVTDLESLRPAVQQAVQALGPITGIIHGAGRLADKLIEKKTAQDFDNVYRPKVSGLENLLACVSMQQLDFLVLFSSIVGFSGNVGQTDYALANEILNKTALRLQRQYPDCRVIAFDWGPWEVGMVTPELKRMFTERDIQLIPVKSGVDFLASQLLSTRPTPAQLIVGAPPLRPAVSLHSDLKSYQIHRRLSAQDNPFLLDHTIGENPVLPATCAAAWMINSCEQLYPGYTFFSINQFRVLKGLVFDANLPDEFVLEVKETSKADHDQVSLDAVIWSKNSRDRTFYHYTSQIDLRREIPPAPQVEPIQASPMAQATPGASLYQDGTLFHGPAFQGVQQVERIDPDGLSMRCSLAQVPVSRQGQFPVATSNPYIYDAIVQCLLIWTQHFSQAPCLPSSLQSMQQYLPLSFDRPYQVEMKIRSASENSAVADIDVLDPQGRLHVHIQGLEGTISRHLAQVIAQRPEKDHLVKPGKPSI